MNYSTTLTQKGQVTIPIQIRKSLNLQTGQKITFFTKNSDVFIKPARDFLSLEGSIKVSKSRKSNFKYSDEEADEAILRHISLREKAKKS